MKFYKILTLTTFISLIVLSTSCKGGDDAEPEVDCTKIENAIGKTFETEVTPQNEAPGNTFFPSEYGYKIEITGTEIIIWSTYLDVDNNLQESEFRHDDKEWRINADGLLEIRIFDNDTDELLQDWSVSFDGRLLFLEDCQTATMDGRVLKQL